MTITSLLFLFCAAAAAVVFRYLPARLKTFWLLLVSAGFIAAWSWKFVLVLTIFALVNFLLGFKVDPSKFSHRTWVGIGIVFNILFLVIFKYYNFYLPALSRLVDSAGTPALLDGLQILLPVGLSFLVVQGISYLVDVSKSRLKAERNLPQFLLYILYFPKLLSGPVERARTLLPRLSAPLRVDRQLLERSLALILTGLFRKLILADSLFKGIPAAVFINPGEYAGQHLVFWLLAYAFALYNDFAGYSSIVRGVSLWFGIELSNNFNLPYLSRSFTEFWTRWHISLSNWLRDYIFFPLSRALLTRFPGRGRWLNFLLPPMATLLVSGLWHGLGWNLLVWGGLHGLFLVAERLPSLWKPIPPPDEQPRWRQALGRLSTFFFAVIAWVPFRMELPVALQYWRGLFNWQMVDMAAIRSVLTGTLYNLSDTNLPDPILVLLIIAAVVFDILQKRGQSDEFLLRWRRIWQILFILILLAAALLAAFADSAAPFVYQSF